MAMPTLDTKVGNSVQPGSAPSPDAPPVDNTPVPQPAPVPNLSAGGQPQQAEATAPTPQPTPPQAQQNPLTSDEDAKKKELDDLLSGIQNNPKTAQVQRAIEKANKLQLLGPEAPPDINALHDFISGKGAKDPSDLFGERKPGQSDWDYFSQNLPEGMKYVAAQMRAHLGSDPKEQRQAFESMYGSDNVKTSGNALMFRPDSDKPFRKVDQQLFGSIADFTIFHALQAPGLLANMGVQAVGNVGSEGAGLLARGLVGAAGGAAQNAVDSGIKGALNQVSSIPQYDDKQGLLDEMGVSNIVANAAGSALVPPAIAGAKSVLGSMVGKIADSLISSDAMPAAAAMEAKAGSVVRQLNFPTFVNTFVKQLYPTYGDNQQELGKNIGNAVDVIHANLTDKISVLKNEALSMAENSDKSVPMNAAMSKAKDILTEEGYKLDKFGLMQPPTDARPGIKPDMQQAFDRAKDFYNRWQGEQWGTTGGTDLDNVFRDVDRLSDLSAYDKTVSTRAQRLYQGLRNSVAKDRNEYVNGLYSASDSPNKGLWDSALADFHNKADAIANFRGMFKTPQALEAMVNKISQTPSIPKMRVLDGLKQVLGEDSDEFKALQGGIIQDQIDSNFSNNAGRLNADPLIQWVTSPENKSLTNRIFPGENKNIFVKGIIESQKVINNEAPSPDSTKRMTGIVNWIIDHSGTVSSAVKNFFGLVGNDANRINYYADKGLIDMANEAGEPAMRQKILDFQSLTSAAREKMQIVDVPTNSEKSISKYRSILSPILAPPSSNYVQKLFQPPFNPAAGQPTPQPAPQAPMN